MGVILAVLCLLATVGIAVGYAFGGAYITQASFSIAVFAFIATWACTMNYRATASPQAQQRGIGRWASHIGVWMNRIGIAIGIALCALGGCCLCNVLISPGSLLTY